MHWKDVCLLKFPDAAFQEEADKREGYSLHLQTFTSMFMGILMIMNRI